MTPYDHHQRVRRESGRTGRAAKARRMRRRRLAASLLAVLAVAALIVTVTGKGEGGHGSEGSQGSGPPGREGAHRPAPARTSPSDTSPSSTSPSPAQTDAEAIESPQVRSLIALGKPIYCAGRKGDEVALTFDDGPGIYTKLAIAKLRKHRIKATFFIVGRNIPLLPRTIRPERALGSVGDHTFTHPLLTSLPQSLAESEILRTQGAVERASGGPVFLFRPPYGAHNATIDSIARDHNLVEILWSVDSKDSLGADYAQIERNVIEGMHPGAIILMHENHGQTIRAMLSIFAALQRKHLRAVSVARLLTDDPPSTAQVRAGGVGCGASSSAGLGGG